jgi:glycosyltransferase involved in cell wall biosynthesis
MKALIFTNMYPSADEPWYGCFVKEQEDALRRLGVDVDVLFFDGRRGGQRYLTVARDLRAALERGSYDVVHAHYGLTGAVAVTQRRVPVVTTFHGSDTAILWQRAISWFVARRSMPLFVSDEAARNLGLPRARVVPSTVDLELFEPVDRREARVELGWDPDRRYVLLPGSRAISLKGPELFDDVVARVQRVVPEATGVSLEGFSRRKAALVLNAVDVTLMTSTQEGSPVVVKESLAALTPVVSVPVGDVAKVLDGLLGCAVVPRDPDGLASAVVAAFETPRDPAWRARVEPYASDVVAERIKEAYESAAAG